MTTFPRIHLNGTNGDVLLKEYTTAYESLDRAIADLEVVTVHGRDYYIIQRTAGVPDPSNTAYAEHRARLEQLRAVYRDLFSIINSICKQLEGSKS